jgi:hypothetical protein
MILLNNGIERMSLSESQIQALQSVPTWQWLPTWDENLASVQAFVTANNRLPSQTATAEEERRLAAWCFAQKRIKQFQDDRQRRLQTT